MSLTKSVTFDVTVDRVHIDFATGNVTVDGTVKGTLLGKAYSLDLPPGAGIQKWVKDLQSQVTDLMDKTGALWSA